MKKLAVLFDNINQTMLEITSYLKEKVEITWISDIETHAGTADSFNVKFIPFEKADLKKYDLVVSTDFKKEIDTKILKVHKSLLPSFEGKNPIQQAIQAGVNVVGVTVYFSDPQDSNIEIVAQYPIFIEKPYNFEQIAFNLQVIEQILFPLVIEKVINNEPFNTKNLMQQNSCGGNCGSCGGCH